MIKSSCLHPLKLVQIYGDGGVYITIHMLWFITRSEYNHGPYVLSFVSLLKIKNIKTTML